MSITFLASPLYIFFAFIAAILYLLAAFVLGVVGAVLTLPVLYYSGYGLVPPNHAPASTDTRPLTAALVQLALGGLFGAASIVATLITSSTIPFLVRYQFARVSPRLETIPGLAFGLGVVLSVWLSYLVSVRGRFASGGHDGWTAGLLATVRATIAFGICFLAVALLSTLTLYL